MEEMSDFDREASEILQISERNWKNRFLLLANLSVYGIFRNFRGVQTRDALIPDDINWKYDVVPEIMDGKNIADFVDPDILQRLDELEKEEELLE